MTISNGVMRPNANCKGWRTEIYRVRDRNGLHALQVSVLRMLIAGLNSRQMARRLKLNVSYIKQTRSVLLGFTGCITTGQLGYWAAKHGYEPWQ